MSWRGDDRLAWDEQKVLEGDPEAIAAVKEAERIFEEERRKGATAFVVQTGKPAQQSGAASGAAAVPVQPERPRRIEEFDPTVDIIMVPRVIGG